MDKLKLNVNQASSKTNILTKAKTKSTLTTKYSTELDSMMTFGTFLLLIYSLRKKVLLIGSSRMDLDGMMLVEVSCWMLIALVDSIVVGASLE